MIASYKICPSLGRGNGWVQQLEIGGEDSTNAITSGGKDNMLLTEYTDFDELPPPRLIGIYEYPHGWRLPKINRNTRYIGTLTQSGFEANNFLVIEYAAT